jgi:epoxyqueuosine reductase
MDGLTRLVKKFAIEAGGSMVRIASRGRLTDAPPSGDPTYLLPSARSIVSFAVALDTRAASEFLSKEDWLSHCADRKKTVAKLYSLGEGLVNLLEDKGFEAINVDVNNNYRPEEGATDVTEMTEFHPEFSHRYAAVASGLGRLGWSGNLMTHEFGALVELGSVITSAELESDPLIEESPCDKCKMCARVCPVEMISLKDPLTVTIAGIVEEIAQKRPNTCCWIGCTGYEGMAPNGKWSNWSPYRLDAPLPETKDELDALCISLQKADPQMNLEKNTFSDYRGFVLSPDSLYYTVCGFCRNVCRAKREERLDKLKVIQKSGTAALGLDGMHVVASEDTEEVKTPYGVKVTVNKIDMDLLREGTTGGAAKLLRNAMDDEVIALLKEVSS